MIKEEISKALFNTWHQPLKYFIESSDFTILSNDIKDARKKHEVLPERKSNLFFKCFRVTPYNKVKVVILGQDIYHGYNQYDGLAFSNSFLDKPQPSLRFILKEVVNDIYNGNNIERLNNYSLYNWAEQGVLLLNVAHTVIKGKPGSCLKIWLPFTKAVIKVINNLDSIVWMLWGGKSQEFRKYITNSTHSIIEASHPASGCYPGKTTFLGSKCFSKCNEILNQKNKEAIIW